jgi:hypothetical protein
MSTLSFDDLVGQSVTETMSKILGTDTWKAINFFFDMKAISREPEEFAALLSKVFGSTSNVLEKKIGESILGKVGAVQQTSSKLDFRQILRLAKAKFPRQPIPDQL